MHNQVNKHCTDVQFSIGDWVFVKLQPYRQLSVLTVSPTNFLSVFFGPFHIIERIGSVAYRLELPPSFKIHNVCHVSLLKKCHIDPTSQPLNLPPDSLGFQNKF